MDPPPPTTTTGFDQDPGVEKHLRVDAPPNGSAETPATMSEQSSMKLADEKQQRQDDGTVEEGPRGDNDDDAPQAALPISQLIFVIIALVLGIFMVRCRPALLQFFWQPIHRLS